jgi:hypothetical protein
VVTELTLTVGATLAVHSIFEDPLVNLDVAGQLAQLLVGA